MTSSGYYLTCIVWLLIRSPLILWYLVLVASIFRWSQSDNGKISCSDTLSKGRWSHELPTENKFTTWEPVECMLHDYSESDIRACLQANPLNFVGDSNARQLFRGIADKFHSSNTSHPIPKHSDASLEPNGAPVLFYWDPFLNRSMDLDGSLVISTGLWQARYLNNSLLEHQQALQRLFHAYGNATRIILLPVTNPIATRLSEPRRLTLESRVLTQMNQELNALGNAHNAEVAWYTNTMTQDHPSLFAGDGLHLKRYGISIQANLLLNQICNGVLKARFGKPTLDCCTTQEYLNSEPTWKVSLSLGIGLLCCGAVLFTTNSSSMPRSATTRKIGPLYERIESLLLSSAALYAVLWYCFIASRQQILRKTNKIVDSHLFITLTCAGLMIGFAFVRSSTTNRLPRHRRQKSAVQTSILSRQQSEEFKGWMQFVILLYHYFAMSRILWIYRIVRVLVGAYLFLTGYGHTRYFLTTGDFSLSRVSSALVRLNLLSGLVAKAMNTSWDFYYFPMLASFWFLVVYATLFKTSATTSVTRIVLRILASVIVITVSSRHERGWIFVHNVIAWMGGPRIDTAEFKFRLATDMYAPYAGMLFALLQTKRPDWFSCRRSTNTLKYAAVVRIALGSVCMLTVIGYFAYARTFTSKQQYNHFHAYASPLPILAYITIRNLTSSLRMHYSVPFAWLGRCSLETFVLQYHIWLAADTKGLLHIGILDTPDKAHGVIVSWSSWRYWVEKTVLTVTFVWLSNRVSTATNVITTLLKSYK